MSNSVKKVTESTSTVNVSDRFHGLNLDVNKPDFRDPNLLKTTRSPLRISSGGGSSTSNSGFTTSTTNTTSSSSSSESVSISGANSGSSNVRGNARMKKVEFDDSVKNYSGPGSGESSPTCRGGSTSNGSISITRETGTGGSGGGPMKLPSSPSIRSGTGGSTPTSPHVILPAGNICPQGIVKTGMASNSKKTDTLGPGTRSYGHGSLMWEGSGTKMFSESTPKSSEIAYKDDPEELKRRGNVEYVKRKYDEALRLYDRAISVVPNNVTYKANRAAALMNLGRLHEALKECQETLNLDPAHMITQQRMGCLLFRFGQVEDARMHLRISGQQATTEELTMWDEIDKHMSRCVDARKSGDWKNVLKECDAAIASGADHCPELFTCKAEALLKLRQLDDAVAVLSRVPKYMLFNRSSSSVPCFGMLLEAYYLFVRAQIDLGFGKFENAITTAERAEKVDPHSPSIVSFVKNVRLVARARNSGNELFKSERFTEAGHAYGEGLRLDPSNAVLYCNRAACLFKLGQWEASIVDCNQALKIQPNYVKAFLRRAASNSKLERWVDAIKDYEFLRREIPDDKEISKSLFLAQIALKRSRGEEVFNMKFGGEVEQVSTPAHFKASISWPGVSTIVYFKVQPHPQCDEMSPFVNTLCKRYPSVNFVMVDIEASPDIASQEQVGVVPTFQIFRNGKLVKEMICPNPLSLETSARHYST